MTVSDRQRLDDHVVARVADAFGLGSVHAVSYLVAGLMNRNWSITASGGRFALKQIIDVPVAVARRNLRVLDMLQQAGVPVCAPLLTPDGDPITEVGEYGYCVLPWQDGSHPRGPELSMSQAEHLGAVAARIHNALNSPVPAGLGPVTRPAQPVTAPHVAIEDARRFHAAATVAGGPFDQTVAGLLDRRVALIERYAGDRPTSDDPAGPYGWTHGDLQYRNIIWRHGHVAAVIDWDRIRVRTFTEEIVRTATIQFEIPDGLDLDRVAAFVAGYRRVISIDGAALADGVHRLWWKRVSNFWHLVYHYDRDDHSCDDLFLSGEALLHWWTAHRREVTDAFTST